MASYDIPDEIIKAAELLLRYGEKNSGLYGLRDWTIMGLGPRSEIIDKFKCPRCDDVHVCRPRAGK